MAAEDRDFAVAVTVDLCPLAVVLELTAEVSSLKFGEHLTQVACNTPEHGSHRNMHGQTASKKQFVVDANIKQSRHEVVVVGSSRKACSQKLFCRSPYFSQLLFTQLRQVCLLLDWKVCARQP